MSHVLERIIEEVRALPPDQRQILREMLDREQQDQDGERARRAALTQHIRGKYAHLPTSSEEFARYKAEEIALEDRRSQT